MTEEVVRTVEKHSDGVTIEELGAALEVPGAGAR